MIIEILLVPQIKNYGSPKRFSPPRVYSESEYQRHYVMVVKLQCKEGDFSVFFPVVTRGTLMNTF